MIGLLLVTHGDLGEHMIRSAGLIFGQIQQVESLRLMPGDSVDELQNRIIEKILTLDCGEGVLILADLPGGSCANAALSAVHELPQKMVSIVAGVNIPMLIQAISRRETMTVLDLMAKVLDSGRSCITRLWPPLAGERRLGM